MPPPSKSEEMDAVSRDAKENEDDATVTHAGDARTAEATASAAPVVERRKAADVPVASQLAADLSEYAQKAQQVFQQHRAVSQDPPPWSAVTLPSSRENSSQDLDGVDPESTTFTRSQTGSASSSIDDTSSNGTLSNYRAQQIERILYGTNGAATPGSTLSEVDEERESKDTTSESFFARRGWGWKRGGGQQRNENGESDVSSNADASGRRSDGKQFHTRGSKSYSGGGGAAMADGESEYSQAGVDAEGAGASASGIGVSPRVTANAGTISSIPRELADSVRQLDAWLRGYMTSSKTPHPPTYYLPLDRARILAVVRATKGNLKKGQELCLRYSALLDKLGITALAMEDVEHILVRQCFYHLPSLHAKDGSALLILHPSRFPPLPAAESELQLYADDLLRALLFQLETFRYQYTASRSRRASNAGTGQAGSPTGAAAADGSGMPRRKAPKDRYTIIVDLSGMTAPAIVALKPVLQLCSEALHHSYPLRIPAVLVWRDTNPDPSATPSKEAKPAAKGLRRFFSFGSGSSTADHPTRSGSGSSGGQTGAIPSTFWITMKMAAYKLRCLPSPVRSRAHLVSDLSPFFGEEVMSDLSMYVGHKARGLPSVRA